MKTPDVIIYYNPDCGTSRNVLGLIRNSGIEPHIIEYLKTPLTRVMLSTLPPPIGSPPRLLSRIPRAQIIEPMRKCGMREVSIR